MLNLNVLWAKKPQDANREEWLPLCTHLEDVACVAKYLWEHWVSAGVREQIIGGISSGGAMLAVKILVFLAYCHDLGKASPIFQDKRAYQPNSIDEAIRQSIIEAGFPLQDNYKGAKETRHAVVSCGILLRHKVSESMAAVVGGHHGLPPNKNDLRSLLSYERSCGFDNEIWRKAQDRLLDWATQKAGLTLDELRPIKLTRTAQVLLSALIIIADWIASNSDLFKLIPIYLSTGINSESRTSAAMEELALPVKWKPAPNWDQLYQRRFPQIKSPARPVQEALLAVVQKARQPGIFVVEAPMGEGKTEAALAAAEVLAHRYGSRGIYFALPTQATSNAMFERVLEWIKQFDEQEQKYSVRLSHGKADLNDTFETIRLSGQTYLDVEGEASSVVVHQWLSGRKKGLLADFAVGTIDQVLMAGLKQKHLVLRHLGLAGKVVLVDECHAYDLYMESYLLKALNWLGAHGASVIILSATLPASRRRAVVKAYLNQKDKDNAEADWGTSLVYPLITYTDGKEIRSVAVKRAATGRDLVVSIGKVEKDDLINLLRERLSEGGYAGIIVNTVRAAQEIYRLLAETEDFREDVELLHAGFITADRTEREKRLVRRLGSGNKTKRTRKRIIVGTQIFEQSMDIDFDLLVTQLCPVDLLLQRIGRLHRHNRDNRPPKLAQPVCYVMDAHLSELDAGSIAVYGRYILMRTCAVLPQTVNLPGDIPQLVAQVYDEANIISFSGSDLEEYEKAKREQMQEDEVRLGKSDLFQIGSPTSKSSLLGWLDLRVRDSGDKAESRAEAAVRDGDTSIEVLVVQKSNGELKLLPGIGDGQLLPRTTPADKVARLIAGCSLRLPAAFSKDWQADAAIDELEEQMAQEGIQEGWYGSRWLKGALVLILDQEGSATLCGYRLTYSRVLGITYEKMEV